MENLGLLNFMNFSEKKAEVIWRTVVHTLELALLSYSGAHIEHFNVRYLGSQWDVFHIPVPFLMESSLSAMKPETIRMRRRSLQCLDKFLRGKMVWVFSSSQDSHDSNERLHLVTNVNTSADIWGPLWKECPVGRPERTIKYRVGQGYIIP